MSAGQFINTIKRLRRPTFDDVRPQTATPTAQNLKENYETGLQAVTDLARQEHPGDPAAEARYRSHFIQQAEQQLRAAQLTDRANREILRSGLAGPNGARSWSDFISDPKRTQAYADAVRVDPGVHDLVDRAITANALTMWDPPASTETNALGNLLKGMQSTDRQRFSNLDLMQLYGVMPASDLNDLMKDQQAIRNQDQAEAKKHIELKHAEDVVGPLFKEAADSTRFGARGVWQPQEYNQFVGQLDRALTNWRQNNNGKIPCDSDIIQIGRSMLFPDESTKPMPAQPTAATVGAGMPGVQDRPTGSEHMPTRDPFGLWVAQQLQAAGKVVSDDTIKAAREKLSKMHPGIEKDFRNMKLEFQFPAKRQED